MNNAIKCMRFDCLLLRPYFKTFLFLLLIPMGFTFISANLMEAMTFTATIMSMTAGYTFSIAEKNDLNRLYGILPIKKIALVGGRYAVILSTGCLALVTVGIVQFAIFCVLNRPPQGEEVIVALLLGITLLLVYASVQIPGYYRFGAIKGRIFNFVPTSGFLLYSTATMFQEDVNSSAFHGVSQLIVVAVIATGIGMVFLMLSAMVSKKIVEKQNCC